MLSPEIQVFIQAIKSELLDVESPEIKPVNFEVLQQKLWFHSIRPVLHQFFQKNYSEELPEPIKTELAQYVQTQAFVSLKYAHETERLLKVFRSENLKVIPYKGILFLKKFYGNTQLRELGDMDFLFHPDSAARGIKILLKEGYKLNAVDNSFERLGVPAFIKLALSTENQYELSLVKPNLQVDFHWELHHGHLPFKIDFESFFGSEEPSEETIFWMLLLHHGGKENWTRMKHFADLTAFLNRFADKLNWDKILSTAKQYRLHKQLIVGFRLLQKHFGYYIPDAIKKEEADYPSTAKVEQLIEDFWDRAEHWATLFPRLRMERIFFNLQDRGFSKRTYLRKFYRTYAKPNPLEQRRIFTFPDNYPTLNFISKVLTHLIRKFR